MARKHQTTDAQLRIGESRDFGLDARASPRNDGRRDLMVATFWLRSPRRGGRIIVMLPATDHAGNQRAKDRRQPEQPKLRDIGSAGKQRRARATRRIDGSIGDRDQEEMNEG